MLSLRLRRPLPGTRPHVTRRAPHRWRDRRPEVARWVSSDKASNKAEDLGGKAKEATGKATGDRDLEAEGKADQAKASVKQAGENVKDAAKDVKDGLTK